MRVCILSPHRDDAAFSLALAIQSWLRAGHQVTVFNIFTHSGYAPYASSAAAIGGKPEAEVLAIVSALRMREDDAFLRHCSGDHLENGAAVEQFSLALADAPQRLRCRLADLCEIAVPPRDPSPAAIGVALVRWLRTWAGWPVALVAPLALGGHVDHTAVRDAVLPCTARYPCAFYEDLPYAMRERAGRDLNSILAHINRLSPAPLQPALGGNAHDDGAACLDPVAWKRQAAMCYPSQLSEEQAGAIAQFCERYGGAERLWVNHAWAALPAAARLSRPCAGDQAEVSLS